MNNKQNRRNFLSTASLGAGVFAFSSFTNEHDIPSSIERLQPMVDGVVPISVEERKQRIACLFAS